MAGNRTPPLVTASRQCVRAAWALSSVEPYGTNALTLEKVAATGFRSSIFINLFLQLVLRCYLSVDFVSCR